jgi:hypothetical protein
VENFKRSSGGMIDKIKLNYADLLWAFLLPPMFEKCLTLQGFLQSDMHLSLWLLVLAEDRYRLGILFP